LNGYPTVSNSTLPRALGVHLTLRNQPVRKALATGLVLGKQ
jgi:hypothetical protein